MSYMYRFSIIIPVYNVQQYLNECLDSVVSQNFKDYEVIMVDDGSTDDSGKICDEYAAKYEQFIIFHQNNKGLSSARNYAIEHANGEYLIFLDSDDYMGKDILSKLSRIADYKTPDIIECAFEKFHDETKDRLYYAPFLTKRDIYTGEDYLAENLKKDSLYEWLSPKYVISNDYAKRISLRFPSGKKYEDVTTSVFHILEASKIVSTPEIIFHYRVGRPGAITARALRYTTEKDKIEIVADNIEKINEMDIKEELKVRLCNNFSCLYYTAVIGVYTITEKTEREELLSLLKKYKWICSYTTEKRQQIVARLIKIIGVRFTAGLLRLRVKLQDRRLIKRKM